MIAAIFSKIAGIALPFPLNLIPGLFKRLWSVISRYPLQCALIAALVACAWLWRANNQHIEQRDAAISQGKAQIEIFRKAQADAIAIARSEKQRKEKANAIINQDTDRDYAALRSRYSAVVMRLAKANTSGTGKADLRGAEISQGDNGPGEGSGLPLGSISISTDDALICGENTARLQAAHDGALANIKEGLAQ